MKEKRKLGVGHAIMAIGVFAALSTVYLKFMMASDPQGTSEEDQEIVLWGVFLLSAITFLVGCLVVAGKKIKILRDDNFIMAALLAKPERDMLFIRLSYIAQEIPKYTWQLVLDDDIYPIAFEDALLGIQDEKDLFISFTSQKKGDLELHFFADEDGDLLVETTYFDLTEGDEGYEEYDTEGYGDMLQILRKKSGGILFTSAKGTNLTIQIRED